ncbi:hypothetical protein [Streptomyces clavifer]|uniref:hypothetical protein n=1 Tax=Streptomyces clavifer TaxID=68188 RepID=UPI003420422C
MCKVILAGSGPAGGPGIDKVTSVTVQDMLKATLRRKDPKHYLFFTQTEGGPDRSGVTRRASPMARRTMDDSRAIIGRALLVNEGIVAISLGNEVLAFRTPLGPLAVRGSEPPEQSRAELKQPT